MEFTDLLLPLILIAAAIFGIVKLVNHIRLGWWGSGFTAATSKGEEIKKSFVKQLSDLGATEEEREKGINRLFDERKQILYWITTNWPDSELGGRKNKKYVFEIIKVSRSLSTLNSRDREFLRITCLLFNANKISYQEFRSLFYSFLNGDHQAAVESRPSEGNYVFPSGIREGTGDPAQAVNRVLKILEQLKNDDPIKVKINNRLRGGGVWLQQEDIEKSVFKDGSPYKLKIGRLHESDYVLNYSGEGSIITIAPPGSGKTQCFVLPNMFNWKGPAFVLDIKGEIYSATHEWREKNIGKVYKFSPLDPANSHSYNPLYFIQQDPDYLWEDSRFVADMMIVPSGGSDVFWENLARDILTAAIAYVCLNNEPHERAMTKILDIIYGIGLEEMIVDLKNNETISAMRQTGHSLFQMETKTLDGGLKSAQTYLSAWQGERIKRVTQKADWHPLKLREEKATVYICINPNEIESYLSLLRVVIAQHIRILSSKLPKRDEAPILFMLDELPRLKKMPPVEEALNIGRQYGIKLWMFAQSYGQLKQAYSNADGFIGSCAVRTFMNIPLNDELAEKISNQLGYQENPFDHSRRRMVEPLELAGPEYSELALIIAANSKPARIEKSYAWQDEELKNKLVVYS